MAAFVWGCDEDKGGEDLWGFSPELFYQTKWEGVFSAWDEGHRTEKIGVDFVFVSDAKVLLSCDTIYPERKDTAYVVVGDDTVQWVFTPQIPDRVVTQSELDYSVDGEVLYFSDEPEQAVAGYWFLTDYNAALDTLCFRRETFDSSVREELVLRKELFDWEDRVIIEDETQNE